MTSDYLSQDKSVLISLYAIVEKLNHKKLPLIENALEKSQKSRGNQNLYMLEKPILFIIRFYIATQFLVSIKKNVFSRKRKQKEQSATNCLNNVSL